MGRKLLTIILVALLGFLFFVQTTESKRYPGGYDDAGDPFIPVTPDDYNTFVHPETLDPSPHPYPHIDVQYKGKKSATIKLPMRFLGKKLKLKEDKVVIDENGREVQIKRYVTEDGDEIEVRISKDERGNPVIEITVKFKNGKVIKVRIYEDENGNVVIEVNGKVIKLPSGTRVEIETQEDGTIIIKVYDKSGKLIGTITIRPDGTVEEEWNDENRPRDEGCGGVYIAPTPSKMGKGGTEVREKVLQSRPSDDALSWPVKIPKEER